ncbi:MAG TPA: single-stranded DNA-binding protein [Solirubrobacteraceae bacterium]|jgi:single-strand DNA-binding protein|nr:single-stranded DNA-binding protein [Solirubrobacteraceae bacterium]
MAGNINRVILTGNLTKDPEVRTLANSGQTVCTLRIACNGRRRTNEGQWEDAPNYFDVTVWGQQGENCGKFLSKGRGVAIDGRLRWRSWETDGQKRQAVDIIAETVQFLGGRDDASNGNGNGSGFSSSVREAESDIPIDTGDFVSASAGSGAADDDIPF